MKRVVDWLIQRISTPKIHDTAKTRNTCSPASVHISLRTSEGTRFLSGMIYENLMI